MRRRCPALTAVLPADALLFSCSCKATCTRMGRTACAPAPTGWAATCGTASALRQRYAPRRSAGGWYSSCWAQLYASSAADISAFSTAPLVRRPAGPCKASQGWHRDPCHPLPCRDGKPRVRWSHFFDVEPVGWSEGGRGRPTVHFHSSALTHPAVQAYMQRRAWGPWLPGYAAGWRGCWHNWYCGAAFMCRNAR